VGVLPQIGQYLPGQLVGWAASVFTAPAQTSFPALVISLGVIAVSLLAAWFIFDKQEL
jgi:hypothetical protein